GFYVPEEDAVEFSLPLESEKKPAIISESGVSVSLLGKHAEDDTTKAPAGVDLPSQWIAAYLERRYFEVTDGIEVKVWREIFDSAKNASREIYDTIRGQKYYLEKHSDSSGVVRLPEVNANVRWWLLSEAITAGGKTWNNRGHVAATFQGE